MILDVLKCLHSDNEVVSVTVNSFGCGDSYNALYGSQRAWFPWLLIVTSHYVNHSSCGAYSTVNVCTYLACVPLALHPDAQGYS